jgi:GT2 family glycosyltransferase
MTSLIIPTTSKNKEYTNNLIKNIKEIYTNQSDVEIILEINDNVTLGENYNNAVRKANGEKIILLHNDMVIKPGFVETMNGHIKKNRITTYTRIEPPIYNDIYPGKFILNCGKDLVSFDRDKFYKHNLEYKLIDGGSQLFFGCLKEDYIGIDGHTFKMFCEDDDLHLRYRLAGFEHKVSSACVYHFVSKTSRTTENYQQIEYNSNRNFIRKWGCRNPNVKYNIGFIIHNCNSQILEILEPWSDNIYVDCDIDEYINKEQNNTKFNLKDRVKTYGSETNNILVEFDARYLNESNFNIIQQLSNIINESGEAGQFEIDIFKIKIKDMSRYEMNLIKCFS